MSLFKLIPILVFVLFLMPITSAEERIKVYPKNVRCGEKLNIGVSSLDPQKTYKLALECGSLNCSTSFEPKEYDITGKSYTLLQEEFDIVPGCVQEPDQSTPSADIDPEETELLTKISADEGKYFARLYSADKASLLGVDDFKLISNINKSCSLKTREIAKLAQPHKFELSTSQACTYSVTMVDPFGVRTAIINQFVNSTTPLEYTIKKELLSKNGTYRLTAVASPKCSSELDRECDSASFTINDATNKSAATECVYMGQNVEGNCLQCGENNVCSSINKCVKDDSNKCVNKLNSASGPRQTPKPNISLTETLSASKPFVALLGVVVTTTLALIFILLFRRIRYRIKQ